MPSVRLPPVEPVPPVVPPVVSAPFETLSPTTETALPPMVTGRPTGASTTLPPRMPSVPSVRWPPPVEPEVLPPVVAASSVLLSPITETALPPTVTGASIEMTPWLPPATLSLPSVLLPAAGAAASVAGAEVPASVLLLSPTSETALPPTVTGTSIDTRPWLPEPTPSLPSVMVTGAGAGAAGAEVSAPSLLLSPSTETALPPTVTGRFTETPTWSPESRPSTPEVSAALAMPAPRTARPPPTSVPRRTRE